MNVDRIQVLAAERDAAITRIDTLTQELKAECIHSIKEGVHKANVCTVAKIPRSLLDRWVEGEREAT